MQTNQQLNEQPFNHQLQIQSVATSDNHIQDPQAELYFDQQNMVDMDSFDAYQIYANKTIYEQNRSRSDFIFILPMIRRGRRYLIAVQKSHIIWIIVKIVVMSFICSLVYNWVDSLNNLNSSLKLTFLWSLKLLPFVLFLVMVVDPGFVMDHQIYESQYQQTNDKKRPKEGKYCEYCKIFVKRKTNHCFRCQHCISSYDHHCGILARCVGKTNIFLFYGFILIANFLYMGLIVLVFYQNVLSSHFEK